MRWGRVKRTLPVLPLVLGITDGILNALTLAAGAVLRSATGVGVSLAVRVGCAALVTAAFTMFIADYAERRAHLERASRELNLTEPGRLAASQLGRRAALESAPAMAVAAVTSLVVAGARLRRAGARPAGLGARDHPRRPPAALGRLHDGRRRPGGGSRSGPRNHLSRPVWPAGGLSAARARRRR